MKLIRELNKGNVRVAVYENTINLNPNPWYSVHCFVNGIKHSLENACWSPKSAFEDMDNYFKQLTQ